MEPSDIKEPLTDEDLNNMVKEYYDLNKRIDALCKYEENFIRNLNISDAHYRMVRIQEFSMLSYAESLRMRLEDYGFVL